MIIHIKMHGPPAKIRKKSFVSHSSRISRNSDSLEILSDTRIPTNPQTIQMLHAINKSTHIEITSLH